MENMSPAQRHECLDRASPSAEPVGHSRQPENKRRVRSESQRRQSAPSLVLSKALMRSRTISRESYQVPVCPETCLLIQSYLACPDRSFLLHGHAQLKTGLQTQERHLFLFSDTLLVTKAKAMNHFKQKAQVRLSEMWTGGAMEEVCEGSTAPDQGFVMGWPTCNCVATFGSSEQKEKWLSLLKSRIKEEKEREEPKTMALSVHAKGINTFAHTKTLPVSNSDSTNEVVRLALQQFGIAGNVKDYQLWAISKRENTPYPLIGHEFPFSIHAHHMRDPPSREVLTSCDRQGALLLPELQPPSGGKQCQFVLKLRPLATAPGQVALEPSQKHFKRRRSLINWAFWRGPGHQLNDPASNAGPRGDLFGQPLSSLCLEDALPKPITDMLFFLYHEGSWTRGIFRRSAGARAVRELRDSLDAGLCELPLTRDHVFIIAGVFKDFLRNIPGSLLCSELYEDWAEVVEEEEEEEKEEEEQVKAIQSLIGRLPAANAVLLRYVAALLHGIQGNADHNQMTSFNLSVCIAPSMLWAPGPSSPEQEGRGAKTVCDLVRFMIDHCKQIMETDPSSVFGGPPQRRDEETPSEESWSCHMTDSSYDSLENELDDDGVSSEGSPALSRHRHRPVHRRHHRPPRGSLDSVLTLSDLDPDGDARTPALGDDAAAAAAALDPPWSPGHGRRRQSEPAVAYAAKLTVCDAREEEEEPQDQRGSAPEHAAPSTPPRTPPRSPLETLRDWAGGRPARGSPPPPREPLLWGTLRGNSRGLHPNSWLKEARRLSLTQQDHPETPGGDEEERRRPGPRGLQYGPDKDGPGKWAAAKPPAPAHHRSTGSLHFPRTAPGAGSDVAVSSPPQHLVHQPGATLSLFRHRRSSHAVVKVTEPPPTEGKPRRSSEPGLPQDPTLLFHPHQGAETPAAAAAAAGQRPGPQGVLREALRTPGLRVSKADCEGGDQTRPRPSENCEPQSGQQGAPAPGRGQGQWRRRRHSSVMAERDFNQLRFSEESYV
ncbi:rho GTPase-activating protein 20 [Gadus morhua]|uniref:rho GTPase-activating protein 20 n=1 Tax=Gadus morhua TaxID=8049 RepID=UPI0011B62A33|nr:rho GTPase-activating protein 20-like [Gadus morhua]